MTCRNSIVTKPLSYARIPPTFGRTPTKDEFA